MFERSEFEPIAERLKALRGTFIMTLNDVPEVRAIFDGFSIVRTELTYTIAGNDNAKRVGEVIITGGGRA